jgi:hypothetical protein
MNPKEVSYSHPQLPLCDTPICLQIQSFTGIETQKYRFFVNMQVPERKKFAPALAYPETLLVQTFLINQVLRAFYLVYIRL